MQDLKESLHTFGSGPGATLTSVFTHLTVGVTVSSILDLEIFQRAGAYVAAGERHLSRPVRWVHAGEIADIAKFLSGGEVLLTAGHGLGSTEVKQRRYISSVAKVGVAALAVELTGRALSRFPPAVVAEAEQLGLPLIGLRQEVPFVEVSAQVLEQLTAATLLELAREADVNRMLTESLQGGADYVTLVRQISQNLGRALMLESPSHEVHAYFGNEDSSLQVLSNWENHSRSNEVHSSNGLPEPHCVRRAVIVQGTTWGWLHMPITRPHSRADEVVLERGAAAIAISLLNERASGSTSRHQQGILINRLMLGDVSGQGFVDRALRLGKDLRKAKLIITITGRARASSDSLEGDVTRDLAAKRFTAVSADIGDAVLSVVAVRADPSVDRLAAALCSDERIVGLSKTVQPEELALAIQQAKAAFYARQPCQFFDRLGILRLLVPLSNGPELSAFVEDELGPLLDHDRNHDGRLYPTLVAFLDCDGNKTTAAEKLFIQRRTLYYRLDKISAILGLPLDDIEVRLRLMVAVRAADLLRSTKATRGLQG